MPSSASAAIRFLPRTASTLQFSRPSLPSLFDPRSSLPRASRVHPSRIAPSRHPSTHAALSESSLGLLESTDAEVELCRTSARSPPLTSHHTSPSSSPHSMMGPLWQWLRSALSPRPLWSNNAPLLRMSTTTISAANWSLSRPSALNSRFLSGYAPLSVAPVPLQRALSTASSTSRLPLLLGSAALSAPRLLQRPPPS